MAYFLTVDGAWGQWGEWGACSVKCGSGKKSRTRGCDSPAPQNGGNSCSEDITEAADCTISTCSSVAGKDNDM